MTMLVTDDGVREDDASRVLAERRRCVGVLLKHIGFCRLSGRDAPARLLEAIAEELEHPDWPLESP